MVVVVEEEDDDDGVMIFAAEPLIVYTCLGVLFVFIQLVTTAPARTYN